MSSANEKVSTTTPSLQEQAAFDAFNRSQELALQTLNAPLQQLTRWSIVTLALVALSVILVLAGAAAALFLNTQVGVLTAVTSTISSIVSGLLFGQLRNAQQAVQSSQQNVLQQLRAASDRLFDQWPFKEPKVVLYAGGNPDYMVGRFVKLDDVNWRDESVRDDKNYFYDFKLSRKLGNRITLTDESRELDVEIDLDDKNIWWMSAKNRNRTFLYRIIAIL